MIAKMLEREGYAVETAGTAKEALKHGDVDLVILKRQFRDVDGSELARSMREEKPELAVLLITGSDLDFTLPNSSVLEMPFKSAQLTSAIKASVG